MDHFSPQNAFLWYYGKLSDKFYVFCSLLLISVWGSNIELTHRSPRKSNGSPTEVFIHWSTEVYVHWSATRSDQSPT